jgi:hypothetical protein
MMATHETLLAQARAASRRARLSTGQCRRAALQIEAAAALQALGRRVRLFRLAALESTGASRGARWMNEARRPDADGAAVFRHACKMDLEGILAKRGDGASPLRHSKAKASPAGPLAPQGCPGGRAPYYG